LLPQIFPASLPEDCKFGKNVKQKPGCNGDKDQYGNYREAHIVALKHHFWWHFVQIWERFEGRRWDTDGPTLFLEEDHMLASDFFETLLSLDTKCVGKCRAMQLHNGKEYSNSLKNVLSSNFYQAEPIGQFSNLGFAFRKELWLDFKKETFYYCSHDDYNWDYTIINIMQKRVEVQSIQPLVPRVQHVGKCGLHTKTHEGSEQDFLTKCAASMQPWPAFVPSENTPSKWSVSKAGLRLKQQPGKPQGWGG
jgi:alpha-1,6-mannosyl-glycoprotein beta-1,2-N-acetylglucosaminyltransferase